MPLPKKWQGLFVGRKVVHPETPDLEGVVKYATSTRMGKVAPAGSDKPSIEFQFLVEWDNGEQQVMDDTDVAKIATDQFVKEDWVHERILKLQECGWDEAKADAMKAKPSSKPRIVAVTASPPKPPRAAPPANPPGPSAAAPKKRKAAGDAAPPPAKKAAAPPPLAANGPAAAAAPPALKPKAIQKKSSKNKAEPSLSGIIGSPERPPARTAAPAPSPRQVAFPGASTRPAPRPKAVSSPFLQVEDLNPALVRGKEVFQYDILTVGDTKYRVYCRNVIIDDSLCFRPRRDDGKPPDMSVDTWKVKEEYDSDEEYVVDCIVAERRVKRGGKRSGRSGGSNETLYLMKFTQYELDPGVESWLSKKEVDSMEAYDAWLNGGRAAWKAGVSAVHTAAGLEG